MTDSYFTIASEGAGKYTEKMSRFLSFAVHVEDSESAKLIVKDYQNLYHDSRHVCWAYLLGADGDEWQLNDNGEPSGTAGKPILGQIRSAGLTNVLVLVVRYFGGIKLGTSGLISAYREAARLALEDGGRLECFKTQEISFSFPYVSMNGVMRIVKAMNVAIVSQTFDNTCVMTIRVNESMVESMKMRLAGVDGVSMMIDD